VVPDCFAKVKEMYVLVFGWWYNKRLARASRHNQGSGTMEE
jgi:hypothetical protein